MIRGAAGLRTAQPQRLKAIAEECCIQPPSRRQQQEAATEESWSPHQQQQEAATEESYSPEAEGVSGSKCHQFVAAFSACERAADWQPPFGQPSGGDAEGVFGS